MAARLASVSADLVVEPLVVATTGDRLGNVPLDRIGGQGVFAREIQVAVLERRAEVAVHSAKDLPSLTPAGLQLAAVPERGDPRDVLVGRHLESLKVAAVVATGSARRRAQLASIRPDLTFAQLRGNMGTRLAMVQNGAVDAVVTAVAALARLGDPLRAHSVTTEALSPAVMLPQVGQGALALECRVDDYSTAEILRGIDDAKAHGCLLAERAALSALGASCSMPFGALACMDGRGVIGLEAVLASADGRVVVRARREGREPLALGRAVVTALMEDEGGSSIEGAAGGPP